MTRVPVMMKGMPLKEIDIQNTFIKKYARKESMIKIKNKKRKILVVKGQLGIRKSFWINEISLNDLNSLQYKNVDVFIPSCYKNELDRFVFVF